MWRSLVYAERLVAVRPEACMEALAEPCRPWLYPARVEELGASGAEGVLSEEGWLLGGGLAAPPAWMLRAVCASAAGMLVVTRKSIWYRPPRVDASRAAEIAWALAAALPRIPALAPVARRQRPVLHLLPLAARLAAERAVYAHLEQYWVRVVESRVCLPVQRGQVLCVSLKTHRGGRRDRYRPALMLFRVYEASPRIAMMPGTLKRLPPNPRSPGRRVG